MPDFEERQQFRQWWLLLLLGAVALGGWAPLVIEAITAGESLNDPVWVLVLVGVLSLLLPAWILFLQLQTAVNAEGINIRYRGLPVNRWIPFSDIESFEPVTYQPIGEYGGWGIRWRGRGKIAYSVSGKEGVRMNLVDGKEVLIGSLRSDELASAISEGARR